MVPFTYLLLPHVWSARNRARRRERGDVSRAILFGCVGLAVCAALFEGAFWLTGQLEDYAELGVNSIEHFYGVADAALALGLPVIACSDSEMTRVFDRRGVDYSCEFYSDLDYDDHGRQIIAMKHEPVAPEDAVARVMRALTKRTAKSVNGIEVAVAADSICIHSDTPGAVPLAKAVYEAVADRL